MSPPTSAIAGAFYKNAYSYIEWCTTLWGQFLSMLLIVVIVMGIKIYVENAETAKRVEIQRITHEQAQANKEWKNTPTLTKAVTVTCIILDALVGKKKPP